MSYGFGPWKPYVPVAERRAKAERQTAKLAKRIGDMQPVRIEGRSIARSFWGKGWCRHLESFSDFESRLPRGRSYVRNNAVCDLRIESGRIEARVIGSEMYRVEIDITPFGPAAGAVKPESISSARSSASSSTKPRRRRPRRSKRKPRQHPPARRPNAPPPNSSRPATPSPPCASGSACRCPSSA